MMDFWHCHKPHDHGQHESDSLANRGYGANNAITAQQGVGFVDITSFMFSESDCQGILFSTSVSGARLNASADAMDQAFAGKFLHVFCGKCSGEVGLYSILAAGVTLFKWQVTCETTSPTKAPSAPECLASTLLSTLSRSGCAKSVIAPHASEHQDASAPFLHLWILNSNVIYTSSAVSGRRVALKVLYKDISPDEGNKMVESMTSDVQDINIPSKAIAAAREALQLSSSLLQERERRIKDWNGGLLQRWTADP